MRIEGFLQNRISCAALIVCAAIGVYANSLGGGLVGYDDNAQLAKLPRGATVAEKFGRLALRAAAPKAFLQERPVRQATLLLDQALYADPVRGGHITNILLHAISAVLVFLIAASFPGVGPWALAAGLFFAVHPLQSESVAYLAGRRDVLYGVLSLAAFYAYLRKHWVVFGVLLVLGLGAKASTIAVPALCLAHALCFGGLSVRRMAWFALAATAVAFAAFWANAAGAGWAIARYGLPEGMLWYGGTPAAHWGAMPRVFAWALWLVVWPLNLSADYTWRVFEPGFDWKSALAVLGLAGIAVGSWRARRKAPVLTFAALWTAIAYAPMLPVFPTGHNIELFAEHWLYVPLAGAAFAFAWGLSRASKTKRVQAAALAALILAPLALRTAVRNRIWSDSETFWTATVRDSPAGARAHMSLGIVYAEQGRIEEAEGAFQRAAEIDPKNPIIAAQQADAALARGDLQGARRLAWRALKLPNAGLIDGRLMYTMGLVLLQSGERVSAKYWFVRAAYRARTRHFPALDGLGWVLALDGKAAEALKIYDKLLAEHPNFERARRNRERVARQLRNPS